jgi:hypothetical protein
VSKGLILPASNIEIVIAGARVRMRSSTVPIAAVRWIAILDPSIGWISSLKATVRNCTSSSRNVRGNIGGIPLNFLPYLTAGWENTIRWIARELGGHVKMRPAGPRTHSGNIDWPGRYISGGPTDFTPANTFGSNFAEQRPSSPRSQFAVLCQAEVRLPPNHTVDEVRIDNRWQWTDPDDVPNHLNDIGAVGDRSQNPVIEGDCVGHLCRC